MKNKIRVILLPFVFAAICLCISYLFLYLRNTFPLPCLLYTLTGYYCPGCGGTRSLAWLLKGDLIRSFIDNPAIILTIIYCILFYTQLVMRTFIKGCKCKKIIPDSRIFYFLLSGILIIFYVIRNFIPALYPR